MVQRLDEPVLKSRHKFELVDRLCTFRKKTNLGFGDTTLGYWFPMLVKIARKQRFLRKWWLETCFLVSWYVRTLRNLDTSWPPYTSHCQTKMTLSFHSGLMYFYRQESNIALFQRRVLLISAGYGAIWTNWLYIILYAYIYISIKYKYINSVSYVRLLYQILLDILRSMPRIQVAFPRGKFFRQEQFLLLETFDYKKSKWRNCGPCVPLLIWEFIYVEEGHGWRIQATVNSIFKLWVSLKASMHSWRIFRNLPVGL